MTDGIIQQALLPIIRLLYEEYQEDNQEDSQSEYTKHSLIRYQAIIKTQQELIEKIKTLQTSLNNNMQFIGVNKLYPEDIKRLFQELIGDSQE